MTPMLAITSLVLADAASWQRDCLSQLALLAAVLFFAFNCVHTRPGAAKPLLVLL